ncbi:MAG: hypothetical protein POELPBGB_00152 [Bacteroidia bacterium]|nr:hypothetical protein [Bacteroidia bacterium]
MKKLLLNPLFVSCTVLSAINKSVELFGYYIPFIHAYMDDFFCMIVILTPALFIQRQFIFKSENYVFSMWHTIIAVTYCSIVFELILPLQSSRHIADALDFVAYSAGGIVFHLFINKPQPIPSVSRAELNIANASSLV